MHCTLISRCDNGPQPRLGLWDVYGELFVDSDLVLFENYIDMDLGDSVDDVSISLTVLGLLTLNEGFGFEPPLNILPSAYPIPYVL